MSFKRQQSIFFALMIGISICVGILATQYNRYWDITKNNNHTLSELSIKWTKQLSSPLDIIAFTRGNPQLKKLITRIIKQYQTYANINLSFRHPDLSPELSQKYGIQNEGELLLSYQNRTVLSKGISEQLITQAITQLIIKKINIGWLISSNNESNYNDAKKALSEYFTITPINLSLVKSIPENIDLLLIVLDTPLSEQQLAQKKLIINNYLAQNKNILWLVSPNSHNLDNTLDLYFGVEPTFQTLISQTAKPYGYQSTNIWAGIANQAIFSSVKQPIITQNIMPINLSKEKQNSHLWQKLPLLTEKQNVFLKRDNQISNSQSSLNLGWILQHTKNSHYRAVILGSSALINNQFFNAGGNQSFITHLLRLLSQQKQTPVQIQNNLPEPIIITQAQREWLGLLLLFIIPLALIMIGFLIIYLKKKQIKKLHQTLCDKQNNTVLKQDEE